MATDSKNYSINSRTVRWPVCECETIGCSEMHLNNTEYVTVCVCKSTQRRFIYTSIFWRWVYVGLRLIREMFDFLHVCLYAERMLFCIAYALAPETIYGNVCQRLSNVWAVWIVHNQCLSFSPVSSLQLWKCFFKLQKTHWKQIIYQTYNKYQLMFKEK